MKLYHSIVPLSLLAGLFFISTPALAEEEMAEEEIQQQEREEAFLARQRRTDDIDVGFTIPTEQEVRERRDRRRNPAPSERTGRAIMNAFEMYEEENVDGAIEVLEGLSPRDTFDRAYVARFLGNLYAASDREQEAITTLNRAVESDALGFSDHAASLLLLGNLHLAEENFEQSLEYFQRWLQFTGNMDPDVFIRMANAYIQMESYPQVIPFARKALHYMREPNRNPYVLQIGAFFEMQQLDDAIAVLEEGVQVLPQERRWWAQLGMLYFQTEQSEKALATMQIAYDAGFLEQQNDFRAMAQMYTDRALPFYAAEVMRRHLESGDIERTARNYAIAAGAYHSAREFVRANEMYVAAAERASERDDRFDYHRRRGGSLLLANEYAEAARAFNAALENAPSEHPQLGNAYMSLAEAHFYNERYSDAIRAAERAAGFEAQRRNAESWAQYIRSTAERRGVEL